MDEAVIAKVFERGVELVSTWGLRVCGAILVLIIGRIAAGLIRRAARRALERAGTDESLVPFLASLVYYAAMAVVVISVMNLFGIETTSLVAVLGAAGLAIGLALQGTLSNFAAGVMLLVFRPFKAGDFVEAAGTSGTIKEISIFTTVLATPDNVKIIVPNSELWGGTIHNYSGYDTRRNDFTLSIGYDDDIGQAIETVHAVVARDERAHRDPEPLVAVQTLGESSVDLVVRVWCAGSDYWPLRFDLMRAFKEAFDHEGITIPYPQQEMHVVPPKTDAA